MKEILHSIAGMALLAGIVFAFLHKDQFSFWWWPAGSVLLGAALSAIFAKTPRKTPDPHFSKLTLMPEHEAPLFLGVTMALIMIAVHAAL